MSHGANNDLGNTFVFNPAVDTSDWWYNRFPDQGSLVNYPTTGGSFGPRDLGLAVEELGGTALVAYEAVIGLTAAKFLAKQAWAFRRLEARRFQVPLMQVSWRRCLYLAAVSAYLKNGWYCRLYRAVHQTRALDWC